MDKGFNYFWPTKILFDKVDDNDLLNSVIQEIFQNLDLEKPLSEFDDFDVIFQKCGPKLIEFREKIIIPTFNKYLKELYGTTLSSYKKYKFKAWFAGTKKGYNMIYHNHSGALFSAVFYILSEDKRSGGNIVFSDPRSNANRGYENFIKNEFDNVTHVPSTGDILVFPSFLYHYVNPYFSNLRIAMPVDLFLEN